jgi:predicted ATP-dependent endonuclease of OLD family
MRLKSLWVDGFKNLNNFKIEFDEVDGITVLIGNNASGKSNILEVISAIFNYLLETNPYMLLGDLTYEFELVYYINDVDIKVSFTKKHHFRCFIKKNKNFIQIRRGELLEVKDFYNKNKEYKYLPSQVIALYSGEELRLWEWYYEKFYLEYNQNIIQNQENIANNQYMLYINKYYWDIALLVMYLSDMDISDIVNTNIKDFNISFNQENIIKYHKNPNEVTQFVHDLSYVKDGVNEGGHYHSRFLTKEVFTDIIFDVREQLFKLFCVAYLPKDENYKLIKRIDIYFENGSNIKDLSEGQKKQILLKLALDVLADENSLLIFDEPDAHIHINNKKLIPDMLLKEFKDKRNVVLTTHSPTLAHSFNNYNLRYLDDGKIDENYNEKEQIINNLSNGFMGVSETQILLQSNKDIILLVEGKTDKVHIETAFEKLKSDYNELEFDIFSIGYASHLANFISGLKTSELAKDKTYIAIFDYDQTGRGFSKIVKNKKSGKIKNFCRYPNTNIYELFICSQDHINNKTKENFEIENMYPIEKQKEIYKKAIDGSDNLNDVEQTYKNLLAKHCSSFDKSNFDGFKTLFDKILEIKNS